jgi:hypothetical protein
MPRDRENDGLITLPGKRGSGGDLIAEDWWIWWAESVRGTGYGEADEKLRGVLSRSQLSTWADILGNGIIVFGADRGIHLALRSMKDAARSMIDAKSPRKRSHDVSPADKS